MQELRQIQRHHDPVRLMGKNLEAEYIPKPVTKYRSHGKGILGRNCFVLKIGYLFFMTIRNGNKCDKLKDYTKII